MSPPGGQMVFYISLGQVAGSQRLGIFWGTLDGFEWGCG